MATTADLIQPADGRNATETLAAPDDIALLTVDEVAALLKVSKSWVYEHTRARGTRDSALPFVKVGKYVRFDRRDLRAYIDSKRESALVMRHRR